MTQNPHGPQRGNPQFGHDAHTYGAPGTHRPEESIPPQPLADDVSNGWIPEDSRQKAHSPLPQPTLFSPQSLLDEGLRKKLRHPGELPWLIVGICFTFAAYTFAFWVLFIRTFMPMMTTPTSYAEADTASTIDQLLAILCILPIIIFFSRGMLYGQMRLTGVRITPTQFPEAYKMLVEAARAHGLRRVPDAYVVLGNGMINAFASGHGHRRFVAIYSDLFEIGGEARDPDALRFIIGHEVGHIAAGHVSYFRLLGISAFQNVPFLSSILSRAQEYTADNFGFRYCPSGAEGTIRTLSAGKYLNKEVNFQELADRAVYERGLFTWLANLNMSHPATTWRAHALRDRTRPGRLIWRPRTNPENTPLSMVPAAEAAALWPDPLQGTSFISNYPEKAENQHWGVNIVEDKANTEKRDRKIPDLLDIQWAGPGRRGFPGTNGPQGPGSHGGPQNFGPQGGGPHGDAPFDGNPSKQADGGQSWSSSHQDGPSSSDGQTFRGSHGAQSGYGINPDRTRGSYGIDPEPREGDENSSTKD
ncbi:M48 family metallopeptidase [Kocuria massiliensis]|uniref:M48 family metallopeptidase n=1 Tax=Kocuria massiliensis TaxID=1926282 RepID=UPI001179A7DC|nr:M48 family metallopeptidase [Kocuria massiliensis]